MFVKLLRLALPLVAIAMTLAACGVPAPSAASSAGAAPAAVAAATSIPPTEVATVATAAPTANPTASPTATSIPPAAVAQPSAAAPAANPQAAATDLPEKSGVFSANGRNLYIKCVGTGSPTIVLEADNGGTVTAMPGLHATLAKLTTTCAYSRANLGRSGSAPKPRTAKDVVDDLHSLLAAAAVPGPYVLVGAGAGGLFDQLYARTYPDQVAGVMVMNSQQAAHPWLEDVSKIMTERELADEKRFLAGGNEESIDYMASSEQLAAAPPPPNMPFEMLLSPCDSGDQGCLKTYPTYKQILQDDTAAWKRGNFLEVPGVSLPEDNPDAVVAAVQRVLAAK